MLTEPTRDERTGSAPADPPADAAEEPNAGAVARLAFVDNVRILLTALVIAHHAGQPYGPPGGDWPLFNAQRSALLGPFFAVNAAFFMGLFFLISGYFVPPAFDRRGARAFLRERFRRLGPPLLIFGLGVFWPLTYVTYRADGGQLSPLGYLLTVYLGERRIEVAHLWFLAHLLVYALGYSAWRVATGTRPGQRGRDLRPPTDVAIAAFALGIALTTFLVRLRFPVNRWERFAGVILVEYAHLPQYAAFFIVGLLAWRHDWFRRLPARTGFLWLRVGAGAALARYAYGLAGGALPTLVAPGGADWRSLLWSGWEALIAVGLGIGLLVLARERWNRQGSVARWLAANAYAAYVLHLWVVVGLQFALADAPMPPFAKFALVALCGLPLAFLLASLVRLIPAVRRVL